MSRHIIIKDGKIDNAIELDPANITYTFLLNDRGDRLPTFQVDGVLMISTTKWLPPEGAEVIESDLGNIGDDWPLAEAE